jgi:hypothetical protein
MSDSETVVVKNRCLLTRTIKTQLWHTSSDLSSLAGIGRRIELLAYNIGVVSSQTPHSFYGISLPPVASPNDLVVSGAQGLKDETYRLLQYLVLASRVRHP